MKEILSSIKSVFKDRIGSPMYVTFMISWIIWNWSFVYTLIFVDENFLFEHSDKMKLDYLINLYDWPGWTSWGHLFLGPIVSTVLIVYLFSIFDIKILCKCESDKIAKRRLMNKLKLAEAEDERKFLEVKEESLKIKEESLKIQTELKDSEQDEVDAIYDRLKANSLFKSAMNALKTCVYDHNGYVEVGDFRIQTDLIAFLDSNRFTEFVGGYRNQIVITEVGRSVLQRYLNYESI